MILPRQCITTFVLSKTDTTINFTICNAHIFFFFLAGSSKKKVFLIAAGKKENILLL